MHAYGYIFDVVSDVKGAGLRRYEAFIKHASDLFGSSWADEYLGRWLYSRDVQLRQPTQVRASCR